MADKAAGLLALLFAQEPSRIIALATGHMDINGDEVTLRLGRVPVRMPPPLDGYLRTLHSETMARDTAAERRLFPGRLPAQHLSSKRLASRLRPPGVRPRGPEHRPDRASLRAASGRRQLPARHHQNTAGTWHRLAGQDHTYAADITRRQQSTLL
ncbi:MULTISPECIES: hypothetical protein [unclassified Streptomyces]|uniref:hypothetical protein n=1 Tax=unclassified Streptomyces TaxID=2593676 RepID=UPI00190732EA|nr:hypothetical protein [Streptomyces sp. HSG2]